MAKIDFEKLARERIAVLFDTREEMFEFLKECDKENIRWLAGGKASEKDYFDEYENFVIEITSLKRLTFVSKEKEEKIGYIIINYKDLKNETIKLFKEIKRIIVNGEATIVFWNDGDKTIVKRGKDQKENKELAILYAYFQKHSGLSKTKANKTIQDLIDNIYLQG